MTTSARALVAAAALAALLVFVGMLTADQATSQGLRDDTTPCREVGPGGSWGSHTSQFFSLAEACRQEWRRAHGTHIIPDSYRGPSKYTFPMSYRGPSGVKMGEGSWK